MDNLILMQKNIEEIDPKTHILMLEEKEKLIFADAGPPPTKKFVVVKDRFFIENYRGLIEVYNLRAKRKISSIFLPNAYRGLEGLATDGNYIYLHLSGDFELDNNDILYVKKTERESSLVETEIEFVGKSLKEVLNEDISGTKATDKKIESRIVSFPVSAIPSDSYVLNINRLTKSNMRLVIPEDIPSIPGISLSSKEDFARIGFAPHGNELGGAFFEYNFLKKGKFCKEEDLPKKEETPFDRLWIRSNREAQEGLEASIFTGSFSKIDERPEYARIPIVFKPNISYRMPSVLGIQENGKTIYVLHQQENNLSGEEGIFSISNPALLIEYAISFKELKDKNI